MRGLGADSTPYALSNLNNIKLDSHLAHGEHIRSFQLMSQRLGKRAGIEHVLVHKPGPLTDYSPAEIDQYGLVFKRGIEEVAAVISKVTVKS